MIRSVLRNVGLATALLLAGIEVSQAQSPGTIIKPATGAGLAILDPNNDGFTSVSTSGFVGSDSDTSKSEIKFRALKPVYYEPIGDLLRGPSGGFSDLVTATDSTNTFVYSDGTNLIFRQRLGNYIPGSKSYTILVDTDGKFGYSGADADPGYSAPGNGKIGNPGFEFEICFQSNFRVAVYNTDTLGRVVLKYSNTPVTAYSQVSVALSYVSGNPDYFMDFYVPMSQLGINANTPLRFASTTVMSPLPALDGPISDIFGYGNFSDYMDAFIKVVTYQKPVSRTSLLSSTTIPLCTAPPSVNAPTVGATSVSGTWSRLDAYKANTAKIYLYRNSTLIDSVNATSGAGWTFTVSSIAAGTEFYARAYASGEGNCFSSGTVTAIKCSGTPSGRPYLTCQTGKGMDGTYGVSGTHIKIYQNVVPGAAGISSFTTYADSGAGASNFASLTGPFVLQDAGTKAWKCDGMNGNGNPTNIGNSACAGGSSTTDMPTTALAITAQEPGKCESMPLFVCPNGSLTATPTITATYLYTGSTISGTATANSYMRLYVDSTLRGVVYADGSGNYSFTSPGLTTGNKIELFAQSSAATCVSAAVTKTVMNYVTPPVITTDYSKYIGLAVTSISGTSTEANNTVVYLYKKVGATTTFVGQTTVTSGAWTVSGITATASTDTYLATQQPPNGALSDTSNLAYVPSANTTSCVTVGSASYAANVSSVSGTVSPSLTNGKVYLYIDDALADSATSVTNSFSINVNTTSFNTLYAGATISFTARTSGGAEKLGCGSASTASITCSALGAPAFSLSPSTISVNNTTTANVSSTTSGLYYSLIGSPDNGVAYANTKVASGSSLSLPSYSFASAGTYPLAVRAINLNEGGTCSSTSSSASLSVVNTPLPIRLLSFNGRVDQLGSTLLEWTVNETPGTQRYNVERSDDGVSFRRIGIQTPRGTTGTHNYNFVDPEVVRGVAYYRLEMAEAGGSISYSQVISVKHASGFTFPSAKPSPFADNLTASIQTADFTTVQLQLSDITGRICAGKSYELSPGLHELQLSGLDGLIPGIYVLQLVQNGHRLLVQRVEKQ